MKKLLALVLALAMVLTLFVGCAKQENDEPKETQQNETQAEEKETEKEQEKEPAEGTEELEMWYYWEGGHQQESMGALIDKYNAAQSKYHLTPKYIPFADFKKQLSIGASADELPDLVVLDSPDHASYAAMGVFADITDRFDASNYFEGPIASATLDGRLYGVPMGANCLALYYNEDMLKEAGVEVPTTWDELKTAAAALTKENVSGLLFCSRQNEEGTFNFMPWVWSTGTTSFEINNPQGIKALTFVKDLVDSGSMSKEVINWTQGDVMNQFISGNAAMMINGPWQIPSIRKEAPDLNWNVTLIPQDAQCASALGGENYAVVAGGNEDGALDFLNFATQEDNIRELMAGFGYIAPRADIADGQFEGDAPMEVFVEQMKYAQPRGPHEEWPSISDAISLAFNEVITGSSTPEEAAATAQETIDSIVK